MPKRTREGEAVEVADDSWTPERDPDQISLAGNQFTQVFVTLHQPPRGPPIDMKNFQLKDASKVIFAVWQVEIGEISGKEHLQMVLAFGTKDKNGRVTRCRVRFRQIKKAIIGHMHACLQHVKCMAAAIKYCQKEHTRAPGTTPTIIGTPPEDHQGERTDLDCVIDSLKANPSQSMFDLGLAAPSVVARHMRFFDMLVSGFNHRSKPTRRKVTRYYFWGESGAFKTTCAFEVFKGLGEVYRVPPVKAGQTMWFPNFTGNEKVLIIDDITPNTIPLSYFLQLSDDFIFQVEGKGTHCTASWDIMIVTSNFPIEQLYPDAPSESRKAVERRYPNRYYFARDHPLPVIPLPNGNLVDCGAIVEKFKAEQEQESLLPVQRTENEEEREPPAPNRPPTPLSSPNPSIPQLREASPVPWEKEDEIPPTIRDSADPLDSR